MTEAKNNEFESLCKKLLQLRTLGIKTWETVVVCSLCMCINPLESIFFHMLHIFDKYTLEKLSNLKFNFLYYLYYEDILIKLLYS